MDGWIVTYSTIFRGASLKSSDRWAFFVCHVHTKKDIIGINSWILYTLLHCGQQTNDVIRIKRILSLTLLFATEHVKFTRGRNKRVFHMIEVTIYSSIFHSNLLVACYYENEAILKAESLVLSKAFFRVRICDTFVKSSTYFCVEKLDMYLCFCSFNTDTWKIHVTILSTSPSLLIHPHPIQTFSVTINTKSPFEASAVWMNSFKCQSMNAMVCSCLLYAINPSRRDCVELWTV